MKCVFLLLLSVGVALLVPAGGVDCPWKWKLRVHLWGISDNNKRRINRTTEEACKKACEEETAFECRSIDYNFVFKYCYLQTVGRADAGELEWASWPRYIYNERARSCPGCKLLWDMVGLQGYAIEGLDDRIIDDVTEAECMQECEDITDFICWSVDYNTNDRSCHINPVRRDDVPGRFREAAGYSFSERYEKCSDCKLQWTSDVRGYSIEGYDETTIEDVSAEDCKIACVNETEFNCRSVDYNSQTRQCSLATLTKSDAPGSYIFTKRSRDNYYERTWMCPSCEWKWNWNLRNEAVSDNNPIKLYGISEQECMTACETTTEFLCKSVDWKFSTGKCFVAKVSRDDAPHHWTSWPPYHYYQRHLRCDCDLEWTSANVAGYRRESNREETTVPADDIAQCKQLCDDEAGFTCMAVTYSSTGDCLLYSTNREHSPGTYEKMEGYTYAEKDHVCPGCSFEFRRTLRGEGIPSLKTLSGLTLRSCRAECKAEASFFCKSVIHNEDTRDCQLSDVGRMDVPYDIVRMPGYKLHERLVDC